MHEKLQGYTKYHGSDIDGDIRLVEGHQHTRVRRSDAVIYPEKVVDIAEERGLDLIITDHNTMEGFDRALTRKANNGYHLEIVPAVEYTAFSVLGKDRHVIALNAQSVPPSGLTVEDVTKQFHRQGASVIAAHPELGSYSMTHAEIEDANAYDTDPEEQFDGMEIVNGGGMKAYLATQRRFTRPIARYINALPKEDLNARSHAIFEANGHNLFAYAGSDSHDDKDIGDVVMVHSTRQSAFEAIKSGNTAIYVRDNIPQATIRDYLKKMAINLIDNL